MSNIPLKPINLKWFIDNLKYNKPFSFARYGDGECHCFLGDYGKKNSNGCTFTPELGKALEQVLQNNNPYRHGILTIAKRRLGHRIGPYLKQNKVKVEWCNGDILLNEMLSGDLFPVIYHLREKRILFVGQPFLGQIEKKGFFTPVKYYKVPPINSFNYREQIIPDMLKSIDRYQIDTIIWCSGLAAKVFIDDIFMATNGTVTQIDFGSAFDGFCEQRSRSYMRSDRVLWDDLTMVLTGRRQKREKETFRKKSK